MKCNCVTEIEKKLADKYTKQLGVKAEATCEPIGFLFTGGYIIYINYKITAPAKGFTKGKIMPVHANFCPFCGKSVKEEAES